MSQSPYPEKIKPDAILEAILEIRFESEEVPEIIIGRLTDYEPWKAFSRTNTPLANIPSPIRTTDPDMRYKPIVDLKEQNGHRNIKIGTHVISFHNLVPYLGWDDFYKETSDMIKLLFEKVSGVSVGRIGLRYINAIEQDRHHIESMSGLNIEVKIKEEQISNSFNLNFRTEPENGFHCLTRVATPDFISGTLPGTTRAYIDIDVFTEQGYKATEKDEVLAWISKARDHKNDAFYKLWPIEVLGKIKER